MCVCEWLFGLSVGEVVWRSVKVGDWCMWFVMVWMVLVETSWLFVVVVSYSGVSWELVDWGCGVV